MYLNVLEQLVGCWRLDREDAGGLAEGFAVPGSLRLGQCPV
jgi:hypothetical protein